MHLRDIRPVYAVAASALAVAVAMTCAEAWASAPPVGPLPKSPVTEVKTAVGSLISVTLPPLARAGYVWRQARRVDPKILSEVGEGNIGKTVVVVFRANGAGKATIAYGLTRGETPRAIRAVTYRVTVASS